MHQYTVQIEAANADGTIWQAITGEEPFASTDNARDVAEIVESNQDVVNEGRWRVLVWDGPTDRDPTYILESEEPS